MFGLKLNKYTHFHPLEVVCRGSESQLQVGENFNLECSALGVKCWFTHTPSSSHLTWVYLFLVCTARAAVYLLSTPSSHTVLIQYLHSLPNCLPIVHTDTLGDDYGNKHEEFAQRRTNTVPTSQTLAQYWSGVGIVLAIYRDMTETNCKAICNAGNISLCFCTMRSTREGMSPNILLPVLLSSAPDRVLFFRHILSFVR